MSPLLFAIWYSAVVLKAICAVSIVVRRCADRFPFLLLYLALSFIKSLLLIFVGMRSNATYLAIYTSSTFVLALLQIGVVFEAFRRLAEPYPQFERWARRIFFGSLALSFAFTIGMSLLNPRNDPGDFFIHTFSRIVYGAAAAALLFAWRLLPRNVFIAIPASAKRNAVILTYLLLCEALANWLMQAPAWRMAAQYVNIAGPCAAYLGWAVLLRRDSVTTVNLTETEKAEAERASAALLPGLAMLRAELKRSLLGQALGLK